MLASCWKGALMRFPCGTHGRATAAVTLSRSARESMLAPPDERRSASHAVNIMSVSSLIGECRPGIASGLSSHGCGSGSSAPSGSAVTKRLDSVQLLCSCDSRRCWFRNSAMRLTCAYTRPSVVQTLVAATLQGWQRLPRRHASARLTNSLFRVRPRQRGSVSVAVCARALCIELPCCTGVSRGAMRSAGGHHGRALQCCHTSSHVTMQPRAA